jgi:hypothetical protein
MEDAIDYLHQLFLWQPLGCHKKKEGYNLYIQRIFWEKQSPKVILFLGHRFFACHQHNIIVFNIFQLIFIYPFLLYFHQSWDWCFYK